VTDTKARGADSGQIWRLYLPWRQKGTTEGCTSRKQNGQGHCFGNCVEKGSWEWRLSGYLNIVIPKVWPGNLWEIQIIGPTPTYWTWTSGGKAQQSILISPPGDCDASSFETTLLRNTSWGKRCSLLHLVHETFPPHPCRMDHILHCHPLCLLHLLLQ